MVSAVAVIAGCRTEYTSKVPGVVYNVICAVLQLVLAPFVVGWIWSIQRGGIMVQESCKFFQLV